MQSHYPETFTRDQGSTEAEWLQSLPRAVGTHALSFPAPGQAEVAVGNGRLHLAWQALPPRRIALLNIARLEVHYRFEQVDAAERLRFMRHFDLTIQRGGG